MISDDEDFKQILSENEKKFKELMGLLEQARECFLKLQGTTLDILNAVYSWIDRDGKDTYDLKMRIVDITQEYNLWVNEKNKEK